MCLEMVRWIAGTLAAWILIKFYCLCSYPSGQWLRMGFGWRGEEEKQSYRWMSIRMFPMFMLWATNFIVLELHDYVSHQKASSRAGGSTVDKDPVEIRQLLSKSKLQILFTHLKLVYSICDFLENRVIHFVNTVTTWHEKPIPVQ